MVSLLEFVTNRNNITQLYEAFSFDKMGKVIRLITSYLKKHVENVELYPYPDIYTENGKNLTGIRWIDIKTGRNVRIGWT